MEPHFRSAAEIAALAEKDVEAVLAMLNKGLTALGMRVELWYRKEGSGIIILSMLPSRNRPVMEARPHDASQPSKYDLWKALKVDSKKRPFISWKLAGSGIVGKDFQEQAFAEIMLSCLTPGQAEKLENWYRARNRADIPQNLQPVQLSPNTHPDLAENVRHPKFNISDAQLESMLRNEQHLGRE